MSAALRRANGSCLSDAQLPGVRAKAILLICAQTTVALGRAVYRHDRKKTSDRRSLRGSTNGTEKFEIASSSDYQQIIPPAIARLLLAQSGHRTHADECPLLGVKRTFLHSVDRLAGGGAVVMSAFVAKRTLSAYATRSTRAA